MSKSNIGPARVDKPSQASHRSHELLAEFTVERFRGVNFLRNWSCPLLEVFELEHLESRRDALGHGEVDAIIIHRRFHAKMVKRTVGAEPFSFFALEAVVEQFEDPIGILLVSINEAVAHAEKWKKIPFPVLENRLFILPSFEAFFLQPWSDCIFPSDRC